MNNDGYCVSEFLFMSNKREAKQEFKGLPVQKKLGNDFTVPADGVILRERLVKQ